VSNHNPYSNRAGSRFCQRKANQVNTPIDASEFLVCFIMITHAFLILRVHCLDKHLVMRSAPQDWGVAPQIVKPYPKGHISIDCTK
jgi:hypothetical protein